MFAYNFTNKSNKCNSSKKNGLHSHIGSLIPNQKNGNLILETMDLSLSQTTFHNKFVKNMLMNFGSLWKPCHKES